MSAFSGRVAILLAALLGVGGLTACSGDEPGRSAPPSASARTGTGLDTYTDPGDGCAQAISAISYADDVLKPLGQEPYQKFDDLVRSRLDAVAGTLALEAEDWPDEPVHRQAQIVQPLAEAAGARLTDDSASARASRATVLLRYRIEAGTLILVCRDATGGQDPTSSR